MKTLGYTLPLLFFILLAVLLWRSLGHDHSRIRSNLIGKPMPAFDLSDLNAESTLIHDNDIIGKPVLLNIWATWCVTCMAEHAFLMKIKQQQRVDIIGLNYRDDRLDALRWLKKKGNPYQTVLFDPNGKTAIDFGIYGTPETFIIDQQGVIRYRHAGMLTEDLWQTEIEPIFTRLNGP